MSISCEYLLPGVSMMLMLWSFHMVYVAADWIVIPLCLSSSIESMMAPTPSLPLTWHTRAHTHTQWAASLDSTFGQQGFWKQARKRICVELSESDWPRASPLSCRCSRALSRSVWSSRSRCARRCRCSGSARSVWIHSSTSDSCWSAPETQTHIRDTSHWQTHTHTQQHV